VIFLPRPGVIGRLQPLEDCDGLWRERPFDGSPYMPGFSSAHVLPLDVGFPDAAPGDWEREFVAAGRWRERCDQVLKTGSHVVDRVCGNQRDLGVGRGSLEVQPVDLSLVLALYPLAQRVWAGGSANAP
jgi:hypothetical protein